MVTMLGRANFRALCWVAGVVGTLAALVLLGSVALGAGPTNAPLNRGAAPGGAVLYSSVPSSASGPPVLIYESWSTSEFGGEVSLAGGAHKGVRA